MNCSACLDESDAVILTETNLHIDEKNNFFYVNFFVRVNSNCRLKNVPLQHKVIAYIEVVWDNFRKAMETVEGVDRYELSITLKNRAKKNGSYARLILESMKKK